MRAASARRGRNVLLVIEDAVVGDELGVELHLWADVAGVVLAPVVTQIVVFVNDASRAEQNLPGVIFPPQRKGSLVMFGWIGVRNGG